MNEPAPQNESTSTTPDAASSGRTAGLHLHPVMALIAAAVAVAISLQAIKQIRVVYMLPAELADLGVGASPEVEQEARDELRRLNTKNHAIYLAAFGGLLGLTLGLGEGLARRRLLPAIVGTILAAALGAGAGGLASYCGYEVAGRVAIPGELNLPLERAMAMQAALWVPISAALGIAFGLLAGRVSLGLKAVFGAIAGGALTAVAYPIVVAMWLPSTSTNTLFAFNTEPTNNSEWVALTLQLGLTAGLTAVLMFTQARRPKA